MTAPFVPLDPGRHYSSPAPLKHLTETQLLYKMLEAAPFALPGMRIFRRNIVNVETKGGWRARAGIKGQSDAYAICRGGRIIEIETKARTGRLSREQKAWRDFCLEWEIPYLTLIEKKGESPDETVLRWLAEIRALAP